MSTLNLPEVQSAVTPGERELQAESITIRIRWFGVALGYLLVNFDSIVPGAGPTESRLELNAILTVGAVYAFIDTVRSWKGQVLLAEFRILVSLMEALFIGLLCYFDDGIASPFRFYYFLSKPSSFKIFPYISEALASFSFIASGAKYSLSKLAVWVALTNSGESMAFLKASCNLFRTGIGIPFGATIP